MSNKAFSIDEAVSIVEQNYIASAVQRAYHVIWELQKREEFLKDAEAEVKAAVGLLRRKAIKEYVRALFDKKLISGGYGEETFANYKFEVFRIGSMKFTLHKVSREKVLPPKKDYTKALCRANGSSQQMSIFDEERSVAVAADEFYSFLTYGHNSKNTLERPGFVCFTVPTFDFTLHSSKTISNLLVRDTRAEIEEATKHVKKKLLVEFKKETQEFVDSQKKKKKKKNEDDE